MIVDESMIGAPVLDRDGHQIGTVKEVRESAFKVDVPLAFDYWLHFDGVGSATVDRVVLLVDGDHLDEFKLDSPDDSVPYGTGLDSDDARRSRKVGIGSDSYGVQDGTMVGEVITGQHPEDDVIVRSGLQSRDTYDMPDVRTPIVHDRREVHTTPDPLIIRASDSIRDREIVGATGRYGVDDGTTVESGVIHNDDIPTTGVTDWGDVSPRFRQDWQSEHGSTGTWEEHEPGYHFGYEMAHDPRFRGRAWDEIEEDLRTEWITWSRRSGAMSDRSSWERVRTSVHHAWDSATERRAA